MFKFFIIAALVPAMVLANVNFRACSNRAPTPTRLTVNNCAGSVCNLRVGQPLYATASGIVSSYGSRTAKASVKGRLNGRGYAYPIPITNVGGIVGGGPIVARVPFSYVLNERSFSMGIRGVSGEVEVNLIGDRGIALGCVRFNVRIQ